MILNVQESSNKEIADLLNTDEEFVAYLKDTGCYLSSGVASQLIGVASQTLRNWQEKGILVPERVLSSGHRRYSLQQIVDFVIKERDICEK